MRIILLLQLCFTIYHLPYLQFDLNTLYIIYRGKEDADSRLGICISMDQCESVLLTMLHFSFINMNIRTLPELITFVNINIIANWSPVGLLEFYSLASDKNFNYIFPYL